MTGELLMTGISDGGKNTYVLERPMILVAVPHPNQKVNQPQDVSVMLRNWMEFSTDDYYMVPKTSVMCIMKPNRDIIADYTQAKIHMDTMEDMIESGMMDSFINDVDDNGEGADDDVEIDQGEEEGHDEFPGWGGDPRL
jgi:hypothetical protein